MPPPKSRRTGQSRRAQYGRFFGYVLAVAGILVSLLLLLVSAVDPRGFSAIKGAALDATAPVSAAGRAVLRGLTDFGQGIGDYFEAGRQNGELRDRLRQAEAQVIQARAAQLENERLRQLLQLRNAVPQAVATGRVVNSSWDSSRRFGILSVGSDAGVRPGMPVRAPEGLIGRVLETGRWGARLLLIVDGMSTVPVRSVRDGSPALAVGTGSGELELKTLEVGVSPFRPGDMLVTSGVGGLYQPNTPVAQVIRVEGETAYARPLASPARVDYVIVEPIYQPLAVPASEGGSPLPTRPDAAP